MAVWLDRVLVSSCLEKQHHHHQEALRQMGRACERWTGGIMACLMDVNFGVPSSRPWSCKALLGQSVSLAVWLAVACVQGNPWDLQSWGVRRDGGPIPYLSCCNARYRHGAWVLQSSTLPPLLHGFGCLALPCLVLLLLFPLDPGH